MAANVMWKNEAKHEIVLIFEARWTLAEFYEIAEKANTLMDEVTHPVHVIMDVRNSKILPEGFMNAITNVSRKSHPNTGIMVMLGVSAFARTFIRWYRMVYPRKPGEKTIYYAGDMDEAQAIIDSLAVTQNKVQMPN